MKTLLCVAVLTVSKCLAAQTITGTNLVLTGPENSQQIGGAGANGDESCPMLSTLGTNHFATCYFSASGAWELGYSGGSYSPIVRLSDMQAAQAVSGAQVAAVQATASSLQSTVSNIQASVSNLQTSVTSLQQQVSSGPSTSPVATAKPAVMMDVISSGPLSLGFGFNTVAISNVNRDTASGYDREAGIYTIPASGLYLCVAKLRLADNVPAQISYGIGVGTANTDNPSFIWSATNSPGPGGYMRNGITNTVIAYYSVGEKVRMYAYVDSSVALPITWAEFSLVGLAQ